MGVIPRIPVVQVLTRTFIKGLTMQKFKDYSPSSWDSKANYMHNGPNRDHWYVAPVIKTRDACLLDESNWDTACKMLKADETKGCEIHNFGHWACGWYDLILIHPLRKDLIAIAEDIERSLSGYPVLSDDDYSQREHDYLDELWEHEGYEALAELMAKRLLSAYAADLDILPDYCDTIIDWDKYQVRTIVEANYPILEENSSAWNIAAEILKETYHGVLWQYVQKIRLPELLFNSLSHDVYHLIVKHKIQVISDDDESTLNVPDFIAVQYAPNQLPLLS